MESPFPPQPGAAYRPRRTRLGLVVAFAISLLVTPAIVLANHQFSDVPTAASYHDEVEALVGAGITSGCGGTNYCPGSAVNRGQMAQFMTRGLGIAAVGFGEIPASEAEEFYVATVALHTGGLPGGTGYVTVDADLSVFDGTGVCPCGVIFSIEETTTLDFGPIHLMGTSPVVQGASAGNGSVNWTFEVPTGTDVEYGIWAALVTDTPTLTEPGTTGVAEPMLTASITAEYSPFGTTFEFPEKPLGLDGLDWGDPALQGDRRVKDR